MSGYKTLFFYLVFASACTTTFSKKTTQTNPLFYAANPDMIKESDTLQIIRGDYELENYKLANYAKFIVISRDRINFRVEITHKWREYANPCDWKAYVKIDNKKYALLCDNRNTRQLTSMWDEQRRRVLARNQFGEAIIIEPYEHTPTTLTSMTVFVGSACLTVYDTDILTTKTKKIELVFEKNKARLVYTWNLEEPEKE